MNILLVEDDQSLKRGISFKLIREGHNVISTSTLEEAAKAFFGSDIDLVLLDVGLPDGSGFDLCAQIREKSNVHIIFLTACDQEVDIVSGYDTGADDYITKPFSLMVLLAKINAVGRRKTENKTYQSLKSGDIDFNLNEMKVYKQGLEIRLSKKELKLLLYLMENARQTLTREQLLNELWDIDGSFVDENTIAVNVRRLREKIEDDPSNPGYILNLRGIGYSWSKRCLRR